jgi:hypothetical protein
VGRLGPDGPWVGFAPTVEDGYALVVGDDEATHQAAAGLDDLLALAIAYFAEALEEPPEELAATHADIGSLVRHLGSAETDAARRRSLAEAIDAVDDGLAADVVVGRLTSCLEGVEDPVARLAWRAAEVRAN